MAFWGQIGVFSLTGSEWLLAGAVGVAFGCVVAIYILSRHDKPEIGAPEAPVVAEDDTTPIDMPTGMMSPCPHGIPVSEPCEKCNGAMKGKHVTLDGEDDGPLVPPPPPVGPRGAA